MEEFYTSIRREGYREFDSRKQGPLNAKRRSPNRRRQRRRLIFGIACCRRRSDRNNA
jgi:hypothetical protein